jgi:hypothetical protein
VERRRGQVPDAALDAAAASLEVPSDNARLAEWTRSFLRGASRT